MSWSITCAASIARFYVPHAAVSITGTIQPETLRRALLPEYLENGLAARLLVAMPPTRPKRWTEKEIDPELAVRVHDLFDRLYALTMAPDPSGYDTPQLVDLDGAAKAAWIDFYDHHNAELDCLDGPDRSAWAKLEGYGARFALIHHCCRRAAGSKTSDCIDVEDIEAGITLTRWFGQETQRVHTLLGEAEDVKRRRELRQWIANKGGRVTVRDLQRGPRRYRENPLLAETALNELVERGFGCWDRRISGPDGGRPTDAFCLADSPDFPIVTTGDGDGTRQSSLDLEVVSPSPLKRPTTGTTVVVDY